MGNAVGEIYRMVACLVKSAAGLTPPARDDTQRR
jgi:hypothetical protein